jgi:hypothetical protein
MPTPVQLHRSRPVNANARLFRRAVADIGTVALLGMGVVSVTDSAAVVGTERAAGGPTGLPQLQQTITQTPPPREPETPFATTMIRAPRFGGACGQCDPDTELP